MFYHENTHFHTAHYETYHGMSYQTLAAIFDQKVVLVINRSCAMGATMSDNYRQRTI